VAIEQPVPAADALVVAMTEAEGQGALARLRALGELQQATSARLWTLRLHRPAREPREAWRKVLAENPDVTWVAPAFRDASGNELLPTGAVAVRFKKKLSDRALEAFAKDEDMALDRRNEFVPEQATFHPHAPREVYLPDLVAKLARREDVAAVWPVTSSRYRKL
jgi:hypothetical protein